MNNLEAMIPLVLPYKPMVEDKILIINILTGEEYYEN